MTEFTSRYSVSPVGRVINRRTGKTLKWRTCGNTRYPRVCLYNGCGGKREYLVHRLVAETHLPNPEGLPVVNHKSGDVGDPSLGNLEWTTYAENSQHSYDELGRISPKGVENGNSALTENEVLEIIALLASGMGQRQIAKQFMVSQSAINKISTGKTWSWLKGGKRGLTPDLPQ